MRYPGFVAKTFGAGVIAGGLMALRKLTTLPNPHMMTGFTIAWVALLLCALAASARPSLITAR